MLITLSLLGGILALLTFIHFFVDWIFQSHSDAMSKHNNAKIRAKHCLIYTLGFVPFFLLCHFDMYDWLISINILFWSHFVEDTYLPVYLWAKYIRKPTEMIEPRKVTGLDGYVSVIAPDPKKGFVEFVQTPIGKILMIAIDQIIHISFLIPVAWLIVKHIVI